MTCNDVEPKRFYRNARVRGRSRSRYQVSSDNDRLKLLVCLTLNSGLERADLHIR